MNKLSLILMIALAACGSKSTAQDTTPTPVLGEGEVDPTLPSWAPKSCTAYQKAVFQALSCDAIEQTKRDQIKVSYDEASTRWKAETDADAARVEEVNVFCTSGADSVRVDTGDKCTANPATTN